jgi:hypothetical protein
MMKKSSLIHFTLSLLMLAMLPLMTQSQDGYKLKSKEGNFTIEFPAKPAYSVEDVKTEIGKLKMHTYLYDGSSEVAYMVAYIDYPADMVNESDNDVLLEAALNGALESWGINVKKIKKETTWRDGHKGFYAKESNDNTYTAYEVILVGNRLYQIAMLQYGKPISKKAIDTFYNSFELTD